MVVLRPLSSFNFLFYIGVQPVNSVVIVSGGQYRDSAIHIHVSSLPQTPLASRLPHNMKQSSLCYTVGPSWLSSLNIAWSRHLFLSAQYLFPLLVVGASLVLANKSVKTQLWPRGISFLLGQTQEQTLDPRNTSHSPSWNLTYGWCEKDTLLSYEVCWISWDDLGLRLLVVLFPSMWKILSEIEVWECGMKERPTEMRQERWKETAFMPAM